MKLKRFSFPNGAQRVYSASEAGNSASLWAKVRPLQQLSAWVCLGWMLVLHVSVMAAPIQGSLLIEPGFSTGDHTWLVPLTLLDKDGLATDLQEDAIGVSLGETRVTGFSLGFFAPEPGGFPSSVAVMVDQGFPRDGVGVLVDFLTFSNADAHRGLFRCGSKMITIQPLGSRCPPESELQEKLAGEEPARLWDSLMEVIAALSQEGQGRKVLLVVSSGDEELASEHPLVSCIEAAFRTRVAVHVLELDGGNAQNSAGLSRLRKLVRETGG